MNKIVITLGDPAGIGPDLGVLLAQKNLNKNINRVDIINLNFNVIVIFVCKLRYPRLAKLNKIYQHLLKPI